MALSPEIRQRKVREIAERHGWTIKKAEEQIASLRASIQGSEDDLLEALLSVRPELLQS